MAAESGKVGAGAVALRLRAEDEEDIAVISAILQDALVTVGDMAYVDEDRRFALFASRLRREGAAPGLERIRCAVRFDEVTTVRRQRFSPRDTERILVLLAVRGDAEGALRIDFAGGAGVRLEVGRILCHLEDLGDPGRRAGRLAIRTKAAFDASFLLYRISPLTQLRLSSASPR